MITLAELASYCADMAGNEQNPPHERTLWADLATEIGDYLGGGQDDELLFDEREGR